VDVFPAAEKEMIRAMISSHSRGHRPDAVQTKDGGGRVAAHEIMIGTPAIRNLIRETNRADVLRLQTGQHRHADLDQNLQELVRRTSSHRPEARGKAANKDNFPG